MAKAAVQDKSAEVDPAEECSHVGHEGGADYHREADPPLMATGYDENGEAVDQEVDTRPAGEQPEMPGFEKPELWDRYEGRRVTEVLLAIGGQCDLTEDPELARDIRLRDEISVTITGTIIGKAYKTKSDKNGVVTTYGTATIQVTEVRAAHDCDCLNTDAPYFAEAEAEDEDDEDNDLASSLAAALAE